MIGKEKLFMTGEEELKWEIRQSAAFSVGLGITALSGLYYISNQLGNLQPQTAIAIITIMVLIPVWNVSAKMKRLKQVRT
jgi:lysozyme family protein